jgi:hypothetical protein
MPVRANTSRSLPYRRFAGTLPLFSVSTLAILLVGWRGLYGGSQLVAWWENTNRRTAPIYVVGRISFGVSRFCKNRSILIDVWLVRESLPLFQSLNACPSAGKFLAR